MEPSTSASLCTPSPMCATAIGPMQPTKLASPPSSRHPPAFGNAIIGSPLGRFVFLLLLICCCLSMLPFGHAQSDQSDQSSSHFTRPLPSSVSLVLVAPSADSSAAPLLPPGGPSNFALPATWPNFPYGSRTNRYQQQQQPTIAAAAGHQNSASGPPTESVPLAVWRRRHQQTMRTKHPQQQQLPAQWPYQPKAEQSMHNNVGWPSSFVPVANSPQIGAEATKKPAMPSSPFDGSFRSQLHQNSRKFAGGLSRLILSSEEAAEEEEEEEEQSAEKLEEQKSHSRKNVQQQWAQRTVMATPNANHPTLNNLERYMPLLARHRPPPKNVTTHWSLANSAELLPSAEEQSGQSGGGVRAERGEGGADGEEDGQDEAGGSDVQLGGGGPCVSANCRTWITITIPSELVGLGAGGEPNGGEAQQQKKERPTAHNKAAVGGPTQAKPPTNGGGRTKPSTGPSKGAKSNNISQPMQPIQPPKSRGMPTARGGTAAKNGGGGAGTSTSSPQTNLGVTTRQTPPDFVFSTKWILPVNGLSVRPNATAASPPPAGGGAWSASTSAPAINATPPFTIGPKPKASPPTPSFPRERPSDKVRPPKPWTHTSGKEKASNVPKSRPEQPQQPNPMQPPTTDTTIEQAAIWASTELIDAIREALAKFRAALSRQGARSRQQQDGANHGEEEWQTQLKTAWDGITGTWLEKAVAEIAMDAASNGRTEISEGQIAQLLQKAGLMDAAEWGRITDTKGE